MGGKPDLARGEKTEIYRTNKNLKERGGCWWWSRLTFLDTEAI